MPTSRKGFAVRAMLRDTSLSVMFPKSENLEIVKADLFDVESLKELYLVVRMLFIVQQPSMLVQKTSNAMLLTLR